MPEGNGYGGYRYGRVQLLPSGEVLERRRVLSMRSVFPRVILFKFRLNFLHTVQPWIFHHSDGFSIVRNVSCWPEDEC